MRVRTLLLITVFITAYAVRAGALPWFLDFGKKKDTEQERKAPSSRTYLDSLNQGNEVSLRRGDFQGDSKAAGGESGEDVSAGPAHQTAGARANAGSGSDTPADGAAMTADASAVSAFGVQVFASAERQRAQEKKRQVEKKVDSPVYIVFRKPYYKVMVGHFSSREDARTTLEAIQQKGYRDAWIAPTR